MKIGITERGDAALDLSWKPWVEAGKPTILITKDPSKLATQEVLNNASNVIVHCTVTGLGGTKIEPNVPSTEDAMKGYWKFLDLLPQKSQVVLRIDPIIPTLKGFLRAKQVLKEAFYAARIRISFMDNYPHVQRRWEWADLAPLPYDFHAPLKLRQDMLADIVSSHAGPVSVCGEPDMDCAGCISDLDCMLLKVTPADGTSGQRKACACLSQKHELLKNRGQCFHKCLYCYWK